MVLTTIEFIKCQYKQTCNMLRQYPTLTGNSPKWNAFLYAQRWKQIMIRKVLKFISFCSGYRFLKKYTCLLHPLASWIMQILSILCMFYTAYIHVVHVYMLSWSLKNMWDVITQFGSFIIEENHWCLLSQTFEWNYTSCLFFTSLL